MRLRQAVLHPSLILKRLTENLKAASKLSRTKEEKAVDIDETAIANLIRGYAAGEQNLAGEGFLRELLDKSEDEGEGQIECAVCEDVSEFFPREIKRRY